MTTETLAQELDGRECGNEITPEEKKAAKDAGLLVVFGASDDRVELRGAIDAELVPGNFRIGYGPRLLPGKIDGDDQDILSRYGVLAAARQSISRGVLVRADFTDNNGWSITTDAPHHHSQFRIVEGCEPYGNGLVLDLRLLGLLDQHRS